MTVKDAYTTKELALMLGITERSVVRKAASENWLSRPRPGRGGGNVWLLSSMPPATRLAVASGLVAQVAAEAQSPPVPIPARTPSNLPASKQNRAASRSMLVQMAKNFVSAQLTLPLTSAYELFAMRYNAGDLPAPDWVRGLVPRLSRASLLNWGRTLAAAGPEALGGKHGLHRIGKGAIDQPYVYSFILAHIYRYPHAGASQIHKGLKARLALQERPEKLPSLRRLQAWYQGWTEQHRELFGFIRNPDQWRSKFRAAFGDAAALVDSVNAEWEMDSTPADLILSDKRRHTIVGNIDVYTRRVVFHVSRTSSSHAVGTCLRKGIESWGVPETVRSDNGADYVSRHIERVMLELGIYHDLCTPFSPEEKPFVERVFKSFLHDCMELLQGYVGHNVSERKALEARKSFAQRMMTKDARVELNLSAEELQAVCDRWANDTYLHARHSRLGCSPYEQARAYDGPIRRVKNPEALRLLCLPLADGDGTRVVGKKGIHLFGDHYRAEKLGLHVGKQVLVRVDDEDRRQIHVYNLDGDEFICTARGVRQSGMKPAEIRNMAVSAKRLQKERLSAGVGVMKEAAKTARVEEIAYERMKADELRARQIEKDQPLRAELMDIHATPGLEAALEAARKPDYTPAPMTEEERAAHEKYKDAFARALADRLTTATPEMPEERYLRYLDFKADYEANLRDGATLQYPPESYRWMNNYESTPECRTQKSLHDMYGENRLKQIRAMVARARTGTGG
ncbi:MAG: Mu transposase C-terminal domain-containing protein [Desulfovibrio sp.]|jgi:hypothetical protein|nr:Mu transposase C-terminal domain-containing protein [Desulfovibrio sp.]